MKFTFVLEGSWWTNDQCLATVGKWHDDNRQCHMTTFLGFHLYNRLWDDWTSSRMTWHWFWRQLECCIIMTYDCWWYWCKNSIWLSSHFAWTNELWKIVPHLFHLPNYGCESDTPGPGPFKMVKMVPPTKWLMNMDFNQFDISGIDSLCTQEPLCQRPRS